jgi:erythronate-4-phosphate dehydrogenase
MQTGKALDDCNIGVIGYGHTGSKVGSIMKTLGCTIIPYDPPKSLRDQSFKSHSIDDVLTCDAITFHVPFTTTGAYPTRNWMDAYKFTHFGGQLIINAARGGIVDESALVEWAKNDTKNRKFVLDVWENEPEINYLVARNAWIGTPHIAGYSIQSKRNATRMVLKSMCATLNIPNSIADSCTSFLHLNVYENWHPLFELSESLKNGLGDDPKQNANHFIHLRQHSKLRNEFRFMTPGKFSRLADYPLIQQLVRVCGGPL